MTTLNARISGILEKVRQVTNTTKISLSKELDRIEAEKKRLTTHLDAAADRIRKTLDSLGQARNGGTAAHPQRTKKIKRIRRSPEQLAREAEAIFQFVKSKGAKALKAGRSANAIRRSLPTLKPSCRSSENRRFVPRAIKLL